MEFILLRLIQLSKRELQVLDELYMSLNYEDRIGASTEAGLVHKDRLLINELIQIERDKREEYSAFFRDNDCENYLSEEMYLIKKIFEFNLKHPDTLIEKLSYELLRLVKKISTRNGQFQSMADAFQCQEIETIAVDQISPYLSTQPRTERGRLGHPATLPLKHSN